MGRASVEFASSPYAGGELPACVSGRSGSSNVTRPLAPDGAASVIVLRRSFFSFFVTLKDDIGCSNVISVEEVLARPGSFILDFFFVGFAPFISKVGAVVIISGAG